jgi:hypothetical protein
MRKLVFLAALFVGFGCSGGSSHQAPQQPPGPSAPMPGDKPAEPPAAYPEKPADPAQTKPDPTPSAPPTSTKAPGLHQTCGDNDACGVGTCVKYYGIAGPRGPEFKTCEIKCDKSTPCPGTMKCATVADGPGQTCR